MRRIIELIGWKIVYKARGQTARQFWVNLGKYYKRKWELINENRINTT